MKNKLTLLTLMFSMLCLTARAQFTAYWQFSDFGLNPQTIKNVIIQPQWTVTVLGGTNTIPGTKRIYQTTSSGIITQSNMIPGSYRVQFTGSDGSVFTFTNYFGTNVTGYVNAAGYFSISTNINPYLYAYSQAQSDSKYISTIGFTNTLTLIAGLPASVTNYGSSSNLLLQFSIPQGSNGVAGANGTNGVGINGTNGAPGSTGPAGTNAVNWNFSSDFNVTSTTNVDVTNSPALAGKPGSAYALTTSVPTTNNLATTNGTYPLMMVGNATTAAGGWPTTWAASSITSPPWATNTPAGIVAAEGFQPATNTAAGIKAAGGLGTASLSPTNQFLQAGTNWNDGSAVSNLNAAYLTGIVPSGDLPVIPLGDLPAFQPASATLSNIVAQTPTAMNLGLGTNLQYTTSTSGTTNTSAMWVYLGTNSTTGVQLWVLAVTNHP